LKNTHFATAIDPEQHPLLSEQHILTLKLKNPQFTTAINPEQQPLLSSQQILTLQYTLYNSNGP